MKKDLSDIEIAEGDCKDCILYNLNNCVTFYRCIVGSACYNTKILRKKEVWETCTKENTKVGDTVRHQNKSKHVVKYIHENADMILFDNNWNMRAMHYFKIKVR